MDNFLLCLDSHPNLLGAFDLNVAPPLLFYSYIPILILTVLFGIFVLKNEKKSLTGKLFFGISISFALWILNILFQWTSIHANVVHFAWQLTGIFEVPVFLLSVYFLYVMLYKKDITNSSKYILILLALPILALTPTVLNMTSFDLVYCQATIGPLWYYIYSLEAICVLWVAFLGAYKIDHTPTGTEKKKAILLTTGVSLFLFIFFASNLVAELKQVYEINLIGPIGAAIFLGLFTYSIVRYKALNMRVLGTQVLVYILWILVFATLFVQNIHYIRWVIGATLLGLIIFGIILIRSTKREHQQRERIEKLATELKMANIRLQVLDKHKSEFVSLASHQLRGPLTSIKGYISLILEGEYGEISDEVRDPLTKVASASEGLTLLVSDYLDVTRIELGKMKYVYADFELKDIVKQTAEELKPNIDKKGLKLEIDIVKDLHSMVHADKGKIKQVITNLIDNSIKYTPSGTITVKVTKDNNLIHVMIKDTGIGIPQDTLPELFQKFTRAPEANKTNVSGTGLGLFVARKIIEAHHGRIWAESNGEGKGSTFTIELEAIQ